MKKIISLLMVLTLLSWFFGPDVGIAEEFETEMTESEGIGGGSGSGETTAPVIKALWAMQGVVSDLSGTDDSPDAGAQFLPSGQYQVSKPISVCAVVSDMSGITDIALVSSEIYYPMAGFGQNSGDNRTGCGQKKGTECQMSQLTKIDAINVFCETIQNSNANLPLFYDIYDFSGLCGQEGELEKETAAVYCCESELLFDDIAGEYKVLVFGQDKGGTSSNVLSGTFSYLELTAFEADFTRLNYGDVLSNSRKIVNGDLVWNEPKGENPVTVRNVGNTRLQIDVVQDDMGLGKTDGIWNIRYGARLGQDSSWQNYWPEETSLLAKVLELSAMDQMDFSIEVLKFPEDEIKNYTGKMNLNAQRAEYFACETSQ